MRKKPESSRKNKSYKVKESVRNKIKIQAEKKRDEDREEYNNLLKISNVKDKDNDELITEGQFLEERGYLDKKDIWLFFEKPYKWDGEFEEALQEYKDEIEDN